MIVDDIHAGVGTKVALLGLSLGEGNIWLPMLTRIIMDRGGHFCHQWPLLTSYCSFWVWIFETSVLAINV